MLFQTLTPEEPALCDVTTETVLSRVTRSHPQHKHAHTPKMLKVQQSISAGKKVKRRDSEEGCKQRFKLLC